MFASMRALISKFLVFALCLLPLAYSLWQIFLLQNGLPHRLGADPGEALVHLQGEWAIRMLLLTLLVTPIRQLTPWKSIIRFRRMLGLFTFFYASLHLSAYGVFLLELDIAAIWSDIEKRPYITVGFIAWLMMMPLALTSTNSMVRWLGQRWKMLHRAIYGVAVLAVLHVAWLAKASYAEPLVYSGILFFALFYRYLQGKTSLFYRGANTPS